MSKREREKGGNQAKEAKKIRMERTAVESGKESEDMDITG